MNHIMSDQEKTYSLGEMLRVGREHAHLTSAQIATELHLSIDVIEKIEQDDFSHAAPTFMLGYIRSYAKLVHISPQHISQAVIAAGLTTPNHQAPQAISDELPPYKEGCRWKKMGIYLLLVILLTVVALLWHHHNKLSVPTPPQKSSRQNIDNQLIEQVQTNNDAIFAAALPEPNLDQNFTP